MRVGKNFGVLSLGLAAFGFVGCSLLKPASDGSRVNVFDAQQTPEAREAVVASTVAIFINGVPTCSGVVLEGPRVLTAAHCFLNAGVSDAAQLTVSFGENATTGPRVQGVGKIRLHTQSDLAVFAIASIPAGYRAAIVHSTESRFAVGEEAVIAGFGDAATTVNVGFGTLRWGPTKYEKWIPEANYAGRAFRSFLVFKGGSNTCKGDSGGPLFRKWNGVWGVTGVNAASQGLCESREGIFADPRPNMDWIMGRNNPVDLEVPTRPGAQECPERLRAFINNRSYSGQGGTTQAWFPPPGSLVKNGISFIMNDRESAPWQARGEFSLTMKPDGASLTFGGATVKFAAPFCRVAPVEDRTFYNLVYARADGVQGEFSIEADDAGNGSISRIMLDRSNRTIFWILSTR